ncbi:MAG: RNA polymerase sigma factor [Phocaeicola sp.]
MKTLNFAQHLLTIQSELLRFALKLTSNEDDANDLLQETTLKALKNEDKYEINTNFRGWIYTIMRNTFINSYRKAIRDQDYLFYTNSLLQLNLARNVFCDSVEGNYDLREMHKVVNSLPKEYRIPFAMYVAGFKYREIAEKLSIPLGTIKSRIHLTRIQLREELKDYRY